MYNIKKLKILRKFNISNIYELTPKINIIFKKTKHIIKEYKLPKNIKVLKILYDIKIKKLKLYFNKFLFFNLYNFFKILKLRLDFILFNCNLFSTIIQSKQNISHKHILLNNKIIKRASYCVKNGDIIHIHKLSYNLIKKILIYNYIIKNITLSKVYKNVYKSLKLDEKLKNIILKFDTKNLKTIICNKNFKIKINKNNY